MSSSRASIQGSENEADEQNVIDGQAGTTGLQISERLATHANIEVLQADPATQRSSHRRTSWPKSQTWLLLPDAAAKESVTLTAGKTRILDASSAFRTNPDWQYGLRNLPHA